MMHAMRGPRFLHPAKGNLIDAGGVLDVMKDAVVAVRRSESRDEKSRFPKAQCVTQKQPDEHKNHHAGEKERGCRHVRTLVMGVMQGKEKSLGIVQQPAMDRVLGETEKRKANHPDQRCRKPGKRLTHTKVAEQPDGEKVRDKGSRVVESALGNSLQKSARST